jgi:lysophospholipase L1-like esterase
MFRQKWIWPVAVGLVSILVGLTALEMGLRWLPLRFFADSNYEFDSQLGWTNRRNSTLRNHWGAGQQTIETNDEGFRGESFRVAKSPDTIRIAVLGDSITEAAQLGEELSYRGQLLNQLRIEKPDAKIEILNFSNGDYGTAQQMLALQYRVLKYEPDLVVLQMFPANDIVDGVDEPWGLAGPQDFYRPYVRLSGDEMKMIYPYAEAFPPARSWAMARFAQLIWAHIDSYVSGKPAPGTAAFWRSRIAKIIQEYRIADQPGPAIYANTFASDTDQIEPIRRGWVATQAALRQIVNICREEDLPLIVISVPAWFQISSEKSRLVGGLNFQFQPMSADKKIEDGLSDEQQVTFVSILPVFEQRLSEVLPYKEGHLSAGGHRVVAEAIAGPVLRALEQKSRVD